MDWDGDGNITFKEFLYSFTSWVGVDNDDEEEEDQGDNEWIAQGVRAFLFLLLENGCSRMNLIDPSFLGYICLDYGYCDVET